jgi:hypothetical protein
VLDLQEALHAFELQRASRPVPVMLADQAVRKGYWVGWSSGPQPVLTDTAEIMKYGTGPQQALPEPVTAELAVPGDMAFTADMVAAVNRARSQTREAPDVEPG